MGQLPSERVRRARPFTNSGVDFAGPLSLTAVRGRGRATHKGYICLFVCLATKAVHLEVVNDLSSAPFVAAFKRFTSRRGHCERLMSDNATNLRGANAELRGMLHEATTSQPETCAFGQPWDPVEFYSPLSPPFWWHLGGRDQIRQAPPEANNWRAHSDPRGVVNAPLSN